MLVPSIFEDNFVDDLFEEMFRSPFGAGNGRVTQNLMNTDVRDVGDKYQLDIELPGYQKEDIHAELKRGYLTISAKHTEEIDDSGKQGKYVRKEIYTGQCNRSFFVGDKIKEEDIRAKFENGILKLEFPKEVKNEVEEKKYIMIE